MLKPVAVGYDLNLVGEFKQWVYDWIRSNLKPCTELIPWEEHIEKCHYTRKVKDALSARREYLRLTDGCTYLYRDMHHAIFSKRERYPAFKYHRGIYAASQDQKVILGAFIRTIEEAVYSQLSQYFLKHVTTFQRAKLIKERLYCVGATYLGLDFSSFESSMTRDISQCTEIPLVDYMAGHLNPQLNQLFKSQLMCKHIVNHRDFTFKFHDGRMSGDLWTSLGNGFTNLMVVKFVCHKLGFDAKGVVEGDDGLFRMDGQVPTSSDFAKLGFHAKIELFDDIGRAGFCKMKFTDSLDQVTEPIERLVKFGWTSAVGSNPKRQLDLLFTKALSLKAEFPNCPMLGPFADAIIRIVTNSGATKRKRAYDEDPGWTAHKIESATEYLYRPAYCQMQTRLFFEDLYHISVSEQAEFEKICSSWTQLQGIFTPIVLDRVPKLWALYYDRFSSDEFETDW